MSSLSTKTSKRGFSGSQKIRATKGKKSPSRKPQRPGRITAAPKTTKKSRVAKKAAPVKKNKPLAKKAVSHSKKLVLKKKPTATRVKKAKITSAKKATRTRPAPKISAATRREAARPQARKRLLASRHALIPKPLPPPPKKPPSPGTLAAVKAFEQALRMFNRQDFGPAKTGFVSLLSKFPEQAEIIARARTYLAICEQRLARSPSVPRNADALYDQGVFQLNKGNTNEAIELFEKALKVEPRADHVHYSLAAAYARLEDVPKSLDALRRAIGIRPIHRSHARRELDFVTLHSNEDFQQLTGFGFDLVEE